ncbi:hypothetical protein [Pseudomonas capsici]|uniref:Uncharacterized protein n=1 Tax=Pseudomonas capsici TaxID=2810614 RepID=A0ABT3C0G7_9PSED|nr:hypothetical protein [Pseudomonas capsici]MBN6716102.1 hypothetical protein [Pseudomonas capsici]MBN6721031.1 hypothetical protein [Pseudomonas capsici]MBN6726138.1 hypothetical protein [Pseudomonas capsici]MCV4269365.1 hypothetical protein [Pseudomonas capsici]MCV4279805.1 hypothetical protein [Pseudomonas capsici]
MSLDDSTTLTLLLSLPVEVKTFKTEKHARSQHNRAKNGQFDQLFAHVLFSSAHQGWRSTYREKGKIERAFDSHFPKMFRMTAYPVKVFFE